MLNRRNKKQKRQSQKINQSDWLEIFGESSIEEGYEESVKEKKR